MNTTETNKKLAESLGWEIYNNKAYITPLGSKLYFNSKKGIVQNGEEIQDLKFHNDWNWIMMVAERIETIETKDGRTFTIDMHRDSVLIFEYGITTNEIVFTEGKGRFENLYNACSMFVDWYGGQNK